MRYKTKVVEIEAIHYDGKNIKEVWEFAKGHIRHELVPRHNELVIHTLEGDMHASIGDYIIKGLKGEFYPCKPDIFKMKYEEVEQ